VCRRFESCQARFPKSPEILGITRIPSSAHSHYSFFYSHGGSVSGYEER